MDLVILACNAQVYFDNISNALAFVQMLAHQITPDQFVDVIRHTAPSAEAVKEARELATVYMGAPS